MNPELSSFAARLREEIFNCQFPIADSRFVGLVLELFALQFKYNPVYQKICTARQLTPGSVSDWTQIPAVPTSAFKELELSCIPLDERIAVFHSSGTTEQKPSRHFHCTESLALYEGSLWTWFEQNVLRSADSLSASLTATRGQAVRAPIFLTPPPEQVPHSSLVHMFKTIWRKVGGVSIPASRSPFFGKVEKAGVWTLDFEAVLAALNPLSANLHPQLLFGTAFSFVHLLDFLAEKNLFLKLPPGSRVMETGGYKNRSRAMPKAELHALIEQFLGVPRENILCEYGMSELSSQAYASATGSFQFPPWARVQITSPETGREVADGESGLICILDLANVFSVAAIQTEDLAVRRGNSFELIGRATMAEPRGCSLMTA